MESKKNNKKYLVGILVVGIIIFLVLYLKNSGKLNASGNEVHAVDLKEERLQGSQLKATFVTDNQKSEILKQIDSCHSKGLSFCHLLYTPGEINNYLRVANDAQINHLNNAKLALFSEYYQQNKDVISGKIDVYTFMQNKVETIRSLSFADGYEHALRDTRISSNKSF